ncbi:UNVERIFIED_ORG: hypothetical protein ABRZ91_000584 [Heyndrickxia coagulans]
MPSLGFEAYEPAGDGVSVGASRGLRTPGPAQKARLAGLSGPFCRLEKMAIAPESLLLSINVKSGVKQARFPAHVRC